MGVRFIVALAFVVLGACRAAAPEPAAPVAVPSAAPTPAGATIFRIDPAASRLHVLVFPDGPLARLGHNHVVSSTNIDGEIAIAPQLGDSTLRLSLPLDMLSVDAPPARAAAGPEFADPVPDDDRAGTRRNMLGDELLDARRFPALRIDALALERLPPDATLRARVRLGGQVNEIVFPARVEIGPRTVRMTGQTTLTHEQLGLTTFSAMLGALRVRETFEVRYELVARRR